MSFLLPAVSSSVAASSRAMRCSSASEGWSAEYAEHIAPEDRDALAAALEKSRSLLEAEDAAGLEAAVDELSGLSYQMTESLYEKLGGEGSE